MVWYKSTEWTPMAPIVESYFRKQTMRKLGYTFDGVGFAAPQPYPSWIFNSTSYLWESPTPMPTNGLYAWDEETTSWVEKSAL